MTSQQPRTPLDDLVSRMHIHFGAANAVGHDYSADDFADVIRILESLPADIAAAEQRGAIKALREAADEFAPEWPDKPDLSATRGVSQTRRWLHNRADQMEGDE